MRIPLIIRPAYPGEPRVYTFLTLAIRAMRVNGQITAIVDTGSPRTLIAPRDATYLKIPFKILPPSSPKELRVAGFVLPAYSMKDVTLGFLDENKAMRRINMPIITVLGRPVPYRAEIEHLPSIVGTDFLEDNKFAFYFDPHNKISYLEDV